MYKHTGIIFYFRLHDLSVLKMLHFITIYLQRKEILRELYQKMKEEDYEKVKRKKSSQ